MHEQMVEDHLRDFMEGFEQQARRYLALCNSPAEKLLLLEFMKLPGAQITWQRPDPNEVKSRGQGHNTSARQLSKSRESLSRDLRQPMGLVWLEWWAHAKVFGAEAGQCCRLIPQFPLVEEDSGAKVGSVDLALFWPKAHGNGHHKIAIDCNCSHDGGTGLREDEKTKLLRKQGWIVIPLPESNIRNELDHIVEQIRSVALEENVRGMRERRSGH
ncbi:MAG: hypothetical protein AB1664_13205 [Thermodesulfobacteriota bacterium]